MKYHTMPTLTVLVDSTQDSLCIILVVREAMLPAMAFISSHILNIFCCSIKRGQK